jgi:hypothetical protein
VSRKLVAVTAAGADDATEFADAAELADRHTALSVVVGWPAHALADLADVPADEIARRGVFVPPTELFWEFDKPPDTVAGPGLDLVRWEVERCCVLALAGSPDALELLGSPLVERSTPIGAELRELTVAFLSQRIADAYRRATATDYARACAAMAAGGTPRWGQVADVIRQLTVGERVLRTGELDLAMAGDRELLTVVAAGELPWSETQAWVESLRDRTAAAVLRSPLPAVPNLPAVLSWLRSVRRRGLADQ